MSNFDFTDKPFGVEFIGPFIEPYKISIAGYLLPHVLAYPQPENKWCLVLDDRIMTEDLPLEQIRPLLPFLADCMAVAAGYSCHGENSVENPNPYKVQIMGIQTKPNLRLVKPESQTQSQTPTETDMGES